MTDALHKLIENGGWLPIEELPKAAGEYLVRFDSNHYIVRWNKGYSKLINFDCADDYYSVSFYPEELDEFIPLDTPERMAKVIGVLLEYLEADIENFQNNDMLSGKTIRGAAKNALQQANEIAEGK